MKSILVVEAGQLGSHTTTYNYCRLLKDKYKITYIGFDEGLINQNIEGVICVHLPQQRNTLVNRFVLLKKVLKELKNMQLAF